MASYVYNHATGKHVGRNEKRLGLNEMQFLQEKASLQIAGAMPDYSIGIFTHAEDSALKQVYIFLSNFRIPGTDKHLVIYWQFLSIKANKLVRFLTRNVSSLQAIVEQTLLRDFARNVDGIRSLTSDN